MARPLRILFAALTTPFPPTNGHRLRTWALVRTLAEDGHEVTLVSLADAREADGDTRPLRDVCRAVELVPMPRAPATTLRQTLDRARALASPLPYGAWRLRSPEFARALEHRLARGRFDVILCDGIYNVQNLPEAGSIPILLNKDDVAHLIFQRYLKLERHPARRLYGAVESWKVRRWERSACRRMTGILACSDFDRGVLQGLCPGVPIFVVPNVVDTEHYAPMGEEEPFTVLFQGGMDWHPNRDAVEFFVLRVLAELRRRVPEARFRVAGRSPSAPFRLRLEAVPGVEFTGTVSDMRDEIAKAAVCVVPLRIGSGTRLKILEAGAMAKPVVSTSLGAEGLAFVDGDDILLADDPTMFAQLVARLLSDAPRRRAIGAAARRRVERQHGLPALRRAVQEALTPLVEPESAEAKAWALGAGAIR